MKPSLSLLTSAFLALACLLAPSLASAQGFSAIVTPPRFEDRVKAGSVYRNVIEITNASNATTRYRLKTNDWTLRADSTVEFSDALAANSCRPWVGLESTEITLGPGVKKRFRFEVAVPAGTADTECRFAIMLEGDPQVTKGSVEVPVSGRIGIIVYLGVGAAASNLEVVGSKSAVVDGRRVPVLSVRNSGNAHGRLEGYVDGKTADGKRLAFLPSSFPILPGETRDLPLTSQPDEPNGPQPEVKFPIQIKGKLEWDGKPVAIDITIEQ